MTTQLTTPIAKNETQATLDAWALTIVRQSDLTVDVANSTFGATLSIRYADGSLSRQVQLSQNGSQLSPAALTAIRNFQNALIGYLHAQALLPAGTDTSDF